MIFDTLYLAVVGDVQLLQISPMLGSSWLIAQL